MSLNASSDLIDLAADSQLYHQQSPKPDITDSQGPRVRKRLDSARSKSKKSQNGYSNGNFVISRDDALILVPGGDTSNADGVPFSRSARNSDTESSDVEVNCPHPLFK